MPKPRPRTLRRTARVHVQRPADPPSGYVHGQTGAVRPEPYQTYLLDGVPHRYDGKCHAGCENVR